MCAATVALNAGFKVLLLGLAYGQRKHFGGCLVGEDFYVQGKAMQGFLAPENLHLDLKTLRSSLCQPR